MPEYEAVIDHASTGDREVVFGGSTIPHVEYTPTSQDDFSWGYNGAGPTNVARSILEHAQGQLALEFEPSELQIPFRNEFVSGQSKSGEWSVSLAEVEQFVRDQD